MTIIGEFVNRIIKTCTDSALWVMSRCTSVVLRVLVLVLLLLVSFWLSLFLHLILVQILVPTKSFSWPAYLDLEQDDIHFMSGNLTAIVPLAGPSAADAHCVLPPPRRDAKKRQVREAPVCSGDPLAAPALLTRGQRYSVLVDLELPDSRPNRHHPMFQVQVTMLDSSFEGISAARRPLLVPYRSKVQRVAATLLKVPTLLLVSSFPETHTIRTTVFENYVDDPLRPARFLQLQLLRTSNLQVQAASLHLHASFTGLQYLLHRHPLLSAAVGTLVNMTLLLAAALVLYFRRLENMEQQRQQRDLATARPQRALRGDNKPSPCRDIDAELRHREQIEDVLPSTPKNNEESSPGKKRGSSLKKRDSFLVKKEKSDQSLEDPSLGSLHAKKVSFRAETNPFLLEKRNDLLSGGESFVGEKDSSLPEKPSQVPLPEDETDRCLSTKSENRESNENGNCTEEKKENCSPELDECCFSGATTVRRRALDPIEKRADLHELDVQFTGTNKEDSREVGAGQAVWLDQAGDCALSHAEAKEGTFLSPAEVKAEDISLPPAEVKAGNIVFPPAEVKTEDIALPPAEVKTEDIALPPAEVKEADTALSPAEVKTEDIALSPPASPGSTASSGSQSSLGDFTVLN